MSELQIEINREGRQVSWKRSGDYGSGPNETLYVLNLEGAQGLEYRVRTFKHRQIVALYNLAVCLYINGQDAPKRRIWGEADLREAVRHADFAAIRAASH